MNTLDLVALLDGGSPRQPMEIYCNDDYYLSNLSLSRTAVRCRGHLVQELEQAS